MLSLQADQSLYNRKGVCYISLFNGLWQVYSHSGINGERKFTTFLEINSKTLDERIYRRHLRHYLTNCCRRHFYKIERFV